MSEYMSGYLPQCGLHSVKCCFFAVFVCLYSHWVYLLWTYFHERQLLSTTWTHSYSHSCGKLRNTAHLCMEMHGVFSRWPCFMESCSTTRQTDQFPEVVFSSDPQLVSTPRYIGTLINIKHGHEISLCQLVQRWCSIVFGFLWIMHNIYICICVYNVPLCMHVCIIYISYNELCLHIHSLFHHIHNMCAYIYMLKIMQLYFYIKYIRTHFYLAQQTVVLGCALDCWWHLSVKSLKPTAVRPRRAKVEKPF